MDKILKTVAFVGMFLGFLCLTSDMAQLRMFKEVAKDSMDISTKAACLQVGINNGTTFYIKDQESKDAFIKLMALNLGCSEDDVKAMIVDYRAINTECDYQNPVSSKVFHINKPTFVAVIKLKFRGILLKTEVNLDNVNAGSNLVKN